MKRRIAVLLGAATFAVAAFAGPAAADSTGSHASEQGQCFGQQASNYASTAKDNSTGQAVKGQATTAPGARAAAVAGYKTDCPHPANED